MKPPITDLIAQEIKWYETHRGTSGKGEEIENAFIAGLEQARNLACQAKEKLAEERAWRHSQIGTMLHRRKNANLQVR